MQACKLRFSQYLITELSSALHDCSKHLVVVPPGEQNFSRVKLEECASDGPDVNTEVVGHAENCGTCQQYDQ